MAFTAGRTGNAQTNADATETALFLCDDDSSFATTTGNYVRTIGTVRNGPPLNACHVQNDTGSAAAALFRVEPKCLGSSSTQQVSLAAGESWEPFGDSLNSPIRAIYCKVASGTATISWRPL